MAEVARLERRCAARVGGFGRIFYRWRQHRIKRKSGNVADFCRRWGRRYRYMVVLDADSVMSGDVPRARWCASMEANPDAGIIQTAPRAAGRDTLYARMQQFATRVYGPLFTAGLHFWQLGEAHYWGHNAIIRVAPFMQHCALARLPGSGALSGEILSHDFVEAALMRRAGWGVWLAYDLPGSYEEMPPNLLDELKRDRRWCQGNLMNFRLCSPRGLHPAHRAVFMTGVMAYVSAPLWFAVPGALHRAARACTRWSAPQYFIAAAPALPDLAGVAARVGARARHRHRDAAVPAEDAVACCPRAARARCRVTAARDARRERAARDRDLGAARADPHAVPHAVRPDGAARLGRAVEVAAARGRETAWGEAIRRHGLHTAFGVAWAVGVYWLDPAFLWWLRRWSCALIASIPLSVYTSRRALGQWLRARGVFLIPEEVTPPLEIAATVRYVQEATEPPGFADAVRDPDLNALVAGMSVARTSLPADEQAARSALVERVARDGPDALSNAERAKLLSDPRAMSALHQLLGPSAT